MKFKFYLIIWFLFLSCVTCSDKSTKSTSGGSIEPMVRFTNQSNYLNVQITKFRHIRGQVSIFKNMDQYVQENHSFILPNLIDGDGKAFKANDRIDVTFECYQVDPQRWGADRAYATVKGNVNIICINNCSYKIE